MEFSRTVGKKLGHYVYALVDPRNNEIFYVGKASGNLRALSHLKEERSMPEKNKRINDIRAAELEPEVEIIRHGIESETACFDVEAAVIDSIGMENLTNAIRGQKISRGRQTLDEVNRLLGSEPVEESDITGNYMLFYIHKSYSPTMKELEIYDCTRQFWSGVSEFNRNRRSDQNNLKFPIALAIVDSVVVRIYTIEAWFNAGTTMSTRIAPSESGKRYEFVGQRILEHQLLNKRIVKDGAPIKAIQRGYSYINGGGPLYE